MANPVGRPTKYHDKMPELLSESMNAGLSARQFCRNNKIDKDTFYEWVKIHPEFSAAFRQGREDAQACWEEMGIRNIENNKFNTNLYKYMTNVMFGWVERKEVVQDINLREQAERSVRNAENQYK